MAIESPAAAVPVEPPAAIPLQLGRYRILQRLATGGMAQIYLASLEGPDGFQKTCVVKRMLPEYAHLESFNKMFVHEAKVAALLSHPNIVHAFDFGREDGHCFLAMEWIQGASLDRLSRLAARANVQLGPQVALNIGIAMASALAYAHTQRLADGAPLRLVHRDVTPGNILVSRDGVAKLADFGVVKSAVNVDGTVGGVVKGKYPYMSPEQVSGREIDGRTDLFSLGVVLWETATGQRLFKRDTPEASIIAISRDPVTPPSHLLAGFPRELERILMKLLRKDPSVRYQTAQALHADLCAYRATLACPPLEQELALLVAKLLPASAGQAASTAVPGPPESRSSVSSGQLLPSVPSQPPAAELSAFELLEQEPPAEPDAPESRSLTPPVLGALAAAAVGSALFWYLVTLP